MKEIKLYKCEFCGTQYNNQQTCKACEQNHKKPMAVEAFKYICKGDDQTGLPIKVKVVFENGKSAYYQRLRSTYE